MQQCLVRRRRGVEACIAPPVTLLAQAGSKSSTTGGTQNHRTQEQKYIRLKTVRDVTQVVREVLGVQGGDAGVHPGDLAGVEARASTLGVSQDIVRDRPAWRDRPATAIQTFHFNF